MFSLTDKSLDVVQLGQRLENPAGGALVTFEGRVRNHNEGLSVKGLDYQAYVPLAEAEGEKILKEAQAKFDLLECQCVHRVGSLSIGEIAVWVGVISAHRGDAFDAARYIIDEAKRRVPIWKRENLDSGRSYWVACHDEDASGQT
ncbi:MAG: molybdenum cofactor biosynthesis protein MoaE [Verrucomicrobia bacterium]|nr:molybdenum cofactor biosynthesis protein MoaE [Verrucomicrobiota bacterium]MDA1065905.1 molybdenum cofactor biosynthesis protein MoaE [Verrucomicrobiota bacterium]